MIWVILFSVSLRKIGSGSGVDINDCIDCFNVIKLWLISQYEICLMARRSHCRFLRRNPAFHWKHTPGRSFNRHPAHRKNVREISSTCRADTSPGKMELIWCCLPGHRIESLWISTDDRPGYQYHFRAERAEPDKNVSRWIAAQKTINLAVTAITLAEVHRGLSRLPNGKRRKSFEERFTIFVRDGFNGRILPFDEHAAKAYGSIAAGREKEGLHCDAVDLMIAAIASNFDASIATRNTGDFEGCEIKLVNPWELHG
jgi:toxin FitB